MANDLVEGGEFAHLPGIDVMSCWISRARGREAATPFRSATVSTFTDPDDIALTYNNAIDPTHPAFATTDGTVLPDPTLYKFKSGDNGPSSNSDLETSRCSEPVDSSRHRRCRRAPENRWRHPVALTSRNRFGGRPQQDPELPGCLLRIPGKDQIYYNNTYNIGPMADLPAPGSAAARRAGRRSPSTFEHDNEQVGAGYVQYSAQIGKLNSARRRAGREHQRNLSRQRDRWRRQPDRSEPQQAQLHRCLPRPEREVPGRRPDRPARRLHHQHRATGVQPDHGRQDVELHRPHRKPGQPRPEADAGKQRRSRGGRLSAQWRHCLGRAVLQGVRGLHHPGRTIEFPVTNYPNPILNGQNVEVDSFANIRSSARAEGFELNYIQQFHDLPAPFDGLGLQGNLTYISTSGQIRTGEEACAAADLPPLNYNAAIFYDAHGFELRLAATYVSRSNLWQVGGDASSGPLFAAALPPRFRRRLRHHRQPLEYYVDVKNITNTKLEFTQATSTAFPVQREFYDIDVLSGGGGRGSRRNGDETGVCTPRLSARL